METLTEVFTDQGTKTRSSKEVLFLSHAGCGGYELEDDHADRRQRRSEIPSRLCSKTANDAAGPILIMYLDRIKVNEKWCT